MTAWVDASDTGQKVYPPYVTPVIGTEGYVAITVPKVGNPSEFFDPESEYYIADLSLLFENMSGGAGEDVRARAGGGEEDAYTYYAPIRNASYKLKKIIITATGYEIFVNED